MAITLKGYTMNSQLHELIQRLDQIHSELNTLADDESNVYIRRANDDLELVIKKLENTMVREYTS